MYIDYLFNVKILDGYNNVVIFDQPENDVDKAFIYEELIPKISQAKFNIQIIITSHEPLLVVNGDSNQIIKAEKNNHVIKCCIKLTIFFHFTILFFTHILTPIVYCINCNI